MTNVLDLPGADEHKKYDSTPAEELIEYTYQFFGWPYKEIASIIGVSPRTLRRFRYQESIPSPDVRKKLVDLAFIADLIDDNWTKREYGFEWLKRRVSSLQDRRPIDIMRSGDLREVVGILAAYYTGAHF